MIKIKANAKINLTLDILGKRDDGYHEVCMVMQSINLHDTLEINKIAEANIILHGDVAGVVKPEDNLVYKAAKLFIDTYNIKSGVEIKLIKKIPVAAGLAGGSTDAAAVLRGLNQLFNLSLTEKQLCSLGAKLGSDIPFCIQGGTMLATGRGEILESIATMPKTNVILIKPKIGVSTAWVYKNYHKVEDKVIHPNTEKMIEALRLQNRQNIYDNLKNVLEYVTIPQYPEIDKIKQALIKFGAKVAMMSGSGPTVFAFADDEQQSQAIAQNIQANFDVDVFVAQTTDKNV